VTGGGEFGTGLLRGHSGALLWIVSLLLMLVGAILCVTVILLPVGVPFLAYASRLFGVAVRLMLPRAVAHPVKTTDKAMAKRGRSARKRASHDITATKGDLMKVRAGSRKRARRVRKKLPLVS
jgi:hypothetical protein